VGLDVIDPLLIRYFAFFKYWKRNGSVKETASAIHSLERGL
jgi:hypothetical protein